MKSHVPVSILPMLTIFSLILLPHAVLADHEYDYFSDRLSREHRDAGDVEDWIDRGSATVTASPRFEDGIRLTAWASESDEAESYEFAIASATYLFEIPRQAQYIEILVRYRGEPHRPNLKDYEDIAGRVWIRNTKRESSRRRYDDEGEAETLYGDTFFLRAKRRSETIKIATAGHVDDGFLEMHIVAEDGEQLDVEYIDVATYRRQPDVRIIHRYARDYQWQPWYRYTYLYFYDGPFYYCTDLGYYIRWSYPIYDHRYLSMRHAYGDYLHHYYRRYPRHYRRNSYRYNVNAHVNKPPKTRRRLNRWTPTHETTRREYSRSRLSITTSKTDKANVQLRVRSLITEQRRTPVQADPRMQRSTVSRKHNALRSVDSTSTQSYRATQQILKRKRLRSSDREIRSKAASRIHRSDRFRFSTRYKRYSSDRKASTRSNAERRTRLYDRTQSLRSRPSTVPSRSQSSSVRKSIEKRKRSTPSNYRSSPSAPQQASSSSKDDDDEKKERSRNTSRTQKRQRRK